ncbi:hypothetical protein COV42_00155 [Candidatus Campbellbacteria bacterium CG11_big_fil_rev_8_21_14_0_20_44_21]|uniref:Uncharacterized protein n=1 Tax=Candidatus Campbellbacteria bacterium CG22_combo_CG10-13_8_21_14_all_43_18 TaxID=1974530 RepID=A0A2H0DXQ3_9BACT|nr:MAG: hypothetical protein COW82_00950 [Candidatus Campbellbacteria bacterium CG22_combo_CG10-13_8_21_14_all_43_18]PIR24551.1 MAG: hypothetical protein COV42_00155 [Candidatus Campbellbacteria bacterium CG11_big_fil_rev_8_21_14_0_20_44_21]
MPNLLPQNNKKKIREEYLLRLLALVLVFSFITFLLASVFFLPSYFLSKNKAGLASEKISFLKSYVEKTQKSGLSEDVISTNLKIKTLSFPEKIKFHLSIRSILDKKAAPIRITSLVLRSINDEKKSLFVGGIASDRDSLIDFTESLKTINDFSAVNLPVSNLAKNKDIDFNIELKFSQETK